MEIIKFIVSQYWPIYHRIKRSFTDSVEYSLPHLPFIGWVGVIGFPLYYWIWGTLFPQPYENLPLRLIGSLLFLGLVLIRFWPVPFRPYLKMYWFITFLYALPFFFTFMLLKNDGNTVWAMSTMAGLTLLILIAHDWVLVTLMFVVGSILALSAYTVNTESLTFSQDYWMQLPIYLFVVVAGSIFNYKSIRLKQEKLKVLASVGTDIAHEMRTPLMTIQNNVHGLNRFFPDLLSAYNVAAEQQLTNKTMRPDQLQALTQSVKQIQSEINHANTVIDILLMNLGKSTIDINEFEHFWMADVVDNAIQRYPFDSNAERAKVSLHCWQNFQFWGSEILMVHVIFNLIKNALSYIHASNKGHIEITLDQDQYYNYIYFKDTGQGIPPHELPSIFDNLYTSGKQGKGTGIGLAFCKKVMEKFKGQIRCQSRLGEYTEFVLCFPGES